MKARGLKGRPPEVIEGLYKILSEGMDAYVVGGSVRDLLLTGSLEKIREYDLLVRMDPSCVCERLVGRLGGSYFLLDRERRIFRIVTAPEFRVVAPFPQGHEFIEKRGIQIDLSPLSGDLTGDLGKRDFTINAMALPIEGLWKGDIHVIDPFGGSEDLRKGLVRAIRREAFREDPLRLLRAYRISSLLGFRVEEETERWIEEESSLLPTVARERIRDEVFLILSSRSSSRWILEASKKGLLFMFPTMGSLPALDGMDRFLSDLRAFGNLYPFLMEHLNLQIGGLPRYGYLKLSALLHDLGMDRADPVGKELILSNRARRLISCVLKAPSLIRRMGKGERAKVAFFSEYGEDGIDALLFTFPLEPALQPLIRECLFYYPTFLKERPGPILKGEEIMEAFHIPPGREVGEMLKALRMAEMEGRVRTKEEALSFLEDLRKGLTKGGEGV